MLIADLSPLAVGSQLSVCPDAAVWTRSGGGANLVVMTDDRLILARLPRKLLKTAQRRLRDGEPVVHVAGEHSTTVFLGSIRKISTIRSSSDLSVEFEQARGNSGTLRVRLRDNAARDQLLSEASNRIPAHVEIVEKAGHRLASALGPINSFFLCALMAWGTHWFFNSRFADMKLKLPERTTRGTPRSRPAPRDARELAQTATFKRPEPPAARGGADPHDRAVASKLARSVTTHKRAAAVVVFALAVLAALGMALSWVGYQMTMSIIIGLTGLSLFWLLARLLHPPRTTELLNTQKVAATVW